MKLNVDFFQEPLSSGLIRRFILSKLTGKKIPDKSNYNGEDYPLYEGLYSNPFNSNPCENVLYYNGFTFYCVGGKEQIETQLINYFQLHRDNTIDDILNG